MLYDIVFPMVSYLYKSNYRLYKFLYFIYKAISDREEIRFIKANVKQGHIVLDIGANIGFYVPTLSKTVGNNGKVYCFEPDKQNYKHLQEAAKVYKNVNTLPYAVGNKAGSLKLYTSGTINVDNKTYKTEEYQKICKVQSITVDKFIKGPVDLIKLDIQGFEFNALKGMIKTLRSNKRIILLIECWPKGLRDNKSSPDEIYKFLEDLGFKIYVLNGSRLVKLTSRALKQYDNYTKYKFENWIATRTNVTTL